MRRTHFTVLGLLCFTLACKTLHSAGASGDTGTSGEASAKGTERHSLSVPVMVLKEIELLGAASTREAHAQLNARALDENPEISRLAIATLSFTLSHPVHSKVLTLLNGDDVLSQKLSLRALGRWRIYSAIERMIELLDSPDSGVEFDARRALARFSGREFTTPEEARLWRQMQLETGERRLAGLADALKTGPAEQLPVVVEELGKSVLMPDKADALLFPLAQHRDFRVRAAVCGALSWRAVSEQRIGALVTALNDPHEVVAASAWRALKAMTLQNLPKESAVWVEWYDTHR